MYAVYKRHRLIFFNKGDLKADVNSQVILYRAMLCIRGTSHGPVSVCLCLSVCLSVRHKSVFY